MKPRRAQEAALDATEAVLVSEVIPATRERVFNAWMSSDQHSAFTGDDAKIEPVVGGAFTTFGGYARGNTRSLEPYRRIIQSWRCEDFPADCPDSQVEVTLEETAGGTLVTLLHTEIPHGQSDQYREGWVRDYLEPLKRFFTGRVSNGVHPADKKALESPRKARAKAGARGKGKGKAAKSPAKVAAAAKRRARVHGKAALGRGQPSAKASVRKTKPKPRIAGRRVRPAAKTPAAKPSKPTRRGRR
jgi:uncharacterized protein YndB with AHSA1/START domain